MMGKPLSGVRVLAAEHFMAGPYASQMMADLGAEVIKIEQPGSGDAFRNSPPWLKGPGDERVSARFLRLNRNKQSLTLDLRKPRGRELFLELAKVSDVVWENMKAGAMDRWGLGYDHVRALSPRIIYASISGFGQRGKYDSPYVDRPAVDAIVQAMSGLMHLVAGGERPYWLGVHIGDLFPGVLAMVGVLAALYRRTITGAGDRVDISMYDGVLSLNERAIAFALASGKDWHRGVESVSVGHGPYQAADGYVILGPVPAMWPALFRVVGHPEAASDPRLSTVEERGKHDAELIRPMIEGWTRTRKTAEVVEEMLAAGVPAARVNTQLDVLECPHVKARHMLVEYEDPIAGPVQHVGNPIKMWSVDEETPRPSPALGQHTDDVLRRLLGLGDEEIAALHNDKVV